jgi:hypothetical protein
MLFMVKRSQIDRRGVRFFPRKVGAPGPRCHWQHAAHALGIAALRDALVSAAFLLFGVMRDARDKTGETACLAKIDVGKGAHDLTFPAYVSVGALGTVHGLFMRLLCCFHIIFMT